MAGGGGPERLKGPVSKTGVGVARFGVIDRRIREVTSRLDVLLDDIDPMGPSWGPGRPEAFPLQAGPAGAGEGQTRSREGRRMRTSTASPASPSYR